MNCRLLALLPLACFLVACATPQVVTVRKSGDNDLTCERLRDEHDEAQDFEQKARKERGVTGTNVAAAILFWPALLGTYSNTEEAVNAAKDRQKNIEKIAAKKGCAI